MPPCVLTYFAQASVPSEIEDRMTGPLSAEMVPNVSGVPVGAAEVAGTDAATEELPELFEPLLRVAGHPVVEARNLIDVDRRRLARRPGRHVEQRVDVGTGVGLGAVERQVDPGRAREAGQPGRDAGHVEPRAEEAWGL